MLDHLKHVKLRQRQIHKIKDKRRALLGYGPRSTPKIKQSTKAGEEDIKPAIEQTEITSIDMEEDINNITTNINWADEEEDNEWQTPTKTTNNKSLKRQQAQPVKTANRFGILHTNKSTDDKNEQMDVNTKTTDNTTITTKKVWIPPIVITEKVSDYHSCINDIKNILSHDNFNVKFNRDNTKVFVTSNKDYDMLINNLKDNKVEYFSLTKQENKTKKLVLKAPPSWDSNQIKDHLEHEGNTIKEVIPLKGKNQFSRSYLITVPQNQRINEIRSIKVIDHCRVQWEPYLKKRNYTQCYRCQRFGHSQSNCNMTPRCVKCTGYHYYKDCVVKKTENTVPYCHNCKGQHTANYTKCPTLIEYLEKRNNLNKSFHLNNNNVNIVNNHVNKFSHESQHNTKQQFSFQEHQYNDTNINTRSMQRQQASHQPLHQLSYRDALLSRDHTRENTNTTDDYTDLINLIRIIKTLKNEINQTTDQMQKIEILLRYINHF